MSEPTADIMTDAEIQARIGHALLRVAPSSFRWSTTPTYAATALHANPDAFPSSSLCPACRGQAGTGFRQPLCCVTCLGLGVVTNARRDWYLAMVANAEASARAVAPRDTGTLR